MEARFTTNFFEKLLTNQTEKSIKIKKLKIEDYYDEPGLHWSNPGLKKVKILTSKKKWNSLLKYYMKDQKEKF
jgi:hypothetical protein